MTLMSFVGTSEAHWAGEVAKLKTVFDYAVGEWSKGEPVSGLNKFMMLA